MKVWNALTGEEKLSIPQDLRHAVRAVAFSADGNRIVSGHSRDPKKKLEPTPVKTWDATTGKEQGTFDGPLADAVSVAFSPEGDRIVCGFGLGVRVWDVTTRKEQYSWPGGVEGVAFSSDGKRIAAVSRYGSAHTDLWDQGTSTSLWSSKLRTWEVSTGKALLTLEDTKAFAAFVAASANGEWIVSGSPAQSGEVMWGKFRFGKIKIKDAATGQEKWTVEGFAGGAQAIAISADGEHVVSGGRTKRVQVWNASASPTKLTLRGHLHYPRRVAFSKDSKYLLSGSGSGDGAIKVWDAATGVEKLTFKEHKGWINGLALDPDGKHVTSWDHLGSARYWDLETGLEKRPVKKEATSADHRMVIDHSGRIWDAVTRQEKCTLEPRNPNLYDGVAISPDGRRIVLSMGVSRMVLDPVHGSVFGQPVWDTTTGKGVLILPTNDSRDAAFSPDGTRIVTGADDGTLKLWDAANGQQLFTLKRHTGWVTCVAFSPDGQRIVSGGTDAMVKIWDAATGLEKLTLKGHTGAIHSVAFSPDGRSIASASADGTVKVWEAP